MTVPFLGRSAGRRARRGSVSWMVGLSIPMLAGFTAMAVDWGLVVMAKDAAQTAADAGAMAAAVHFDDRIVAENAANAYTTAVQINGMPTVMDSVTWGTWDGTTFTPSTYAAADAVRVTASVDVRMPFSALFGITDMVVRAEAGAAPNVIPGRAPDTVIVLDVTGSMNATELQATKDGAIDLVRCVAENATGDSRASVVVFTGTDYVVQDWTTYDDGGVDLENAIDNVHSCWGGGGYPSCMLGTNQSAGMAAALEQLAAADATRPDDVGQAVVLFSDGTPNPLNNTCTSGNYTGSATRPYRPNTMTNTGLKGLRGLCTGGVSFGTKTIPRVSTTSPAPYTASSSSRPTLSHYYGWAEYYQDYAEQNEIDIHTVFYYDLSDGNAVERAQGIAFMENQVATNQDDPDLAAEALVADDVADISDAFTDICISTTKGTPGLLF